MAYCIVRIIKFGDFSQNIMFLNLANFKFGDLDPQPKNDVTTTT